MIFSQAIALKKNSALNCIEKVQIKVTAHAFMESLNVEKIILLFFIEF